MITSFRGIVPIAAILCFIASVFVYGRGEGFGGGAILDTYPVDSATISSASNAQRLSSFNDFDFAVIENIANAGSETTALITSIHVGVRESLMEIYRKRSAQPR